MIDFGAENFGEWTVQQIITPKLIDKLHTCVVIARAPRTKNAFLF